LFISDRPIYFRLIFAGVKPVTFLKAFAQVKKSFLFLFSLSFLVAAHGQQTIQQYLSGTDKDHTVKWEFMVSSGRDSGRRTTIAVPSCWEMQGFGTYSYSTDVTPDENGSYRYRFHVRPQYRGKRIFIVFDGSMTDTEVKINGQLAGPVHQGGFYQFKYDVTRLIRFDEANLLEATVRKKSANNSVNRAERQSDFWLFGGIYRPVYLEIFPPTFIERVAIDAKADGNFRMQVFHNATASHTIEAQVFDLSGKAVGKPFQLAKGDSMLRHQFAAIKAWDPEQPNLYKVVVSIKENENTVHTIEQRFGFRTAELRPLDGFYVNGKKVIFKGVNRHSQWSESGRTLSRAVHLVDIGSIKGMNMNAVRMSHYPPDKEFLDLCDSLGLFVIDELTGWQKAYDTITAKRLVKELIVRDVNHPSIVLWANGNEGGWNRAVDDDYHWYDPQERTVIHPWERFNGTNTKHYPDFKYVQNEVASPKEVFFPTEFMHGLYDGGHGAALEDFWNEMMRHPYTAGGFLWALHDEGVVRGDRHDSIDVAGNRAPDGIVGPHREREASYYTIRELWSPVYIETKDIAGKFNGNIEVENRYLYTNLDKIKFEWKAAVFPSAHDKNIALKIVKQGRVNGPSVAPGEKGMLTIPLPNNLEAQAFYLTAFNWKGDTVCTWSWPLASNARFVQRMPPLPPPSPITTTENEQSVSVVCDGITYQFEKATGFLQKVVSGKKLVSLSAGPALAGSKPVLKELNSYRQGADHIIEPLYFGDSLKVKWIFHSVALPRMEYSYLTKDTFDFAGITFNYPEEKITGIKYLGRGPYRAWKNRLKGQQIGVWQKAYNNTVTGDSWNYPEFKGYYADLHWMQLQTREGNFIIIPAQSGGYLQLLKPEKPQAALNNNTSPPFPEGNIGFMNAIPAIGTKFNRPEVMGPQSQKNVRQGSIPVTGTLIFDFR
jgi:hypothetical protein